MGKQEQQEQVILRIIEDSNEFAQMREPWNHFLEKSGNDNIYLTWEWLYRWWQVYNENRSLFIIVAEQNNQIVGLLPLLKHQITYFSCFTFQRLEFLSTGENEKEEVCPSFMAFPILPGLETIVSAGVVDFLVNKCGHQWDELVLSPVLEEDPNTKLFKQHFSQHSAYLCKSEVIGINAFTDISQGWDELFESFGKKTQKKVRHGRRYIESRESWDYRFLDDEQEFEYFFDGFVNLHKARWDNSGIFSNQKFYTFQKKVCTDFFQKGWLKLSLMTAENDVVSGNLDYSYKNNIYGYLTAYNPNFKTNLSLGFIGMTHCLEDFANSGHQVYDWYRFLDAGNYKNHLSLTQRNVELQSYQKRSLKMLLQRFLVKLSKCMSLVGRKLSGSSGKA